MTQRIRNVLLERIEFVVLIALGLLTLALPKGLPGGIAALGVVSGAGVALNAVAVVLIYRANRVINFAQVAAGAAGGAVFAFLANRQQFLVLTHVVCNDCVKTVTIPNDGHPFSAPVNVPHWAELLNFWLAAAVGVLVALLLTLVLFALLHMRRLATTSRLIATVFTIGIAQAFGLINTIMGNLYHDPLSALKVAPLPFTWNLSVGGVTLGTTEVLTSAFLLVAALYLVVFFRRSLHGMMLRGASENPARAQTLGVNTVAVNLRVWIIAGLISGVVGVVNSARPGGASGAFSIVAILAACVVASFASIPRAVLASLVFAIVAQAALWSFNTTASVDAVALIVIVVVLLAQRRRAGRVDVTDLSVGQTKELRPIPQELRNHPVVRRWIRVTTTVVAVLVLGLPWVLTPSQTTQSVFVVLYAIVGLSLLILTGWAGQISLGHMGLAAVGAYLTALIKLPFPIPLIIAALGGAAAALIIGLPALRLRGLHLAVTTLAFSAAVASVLLAPKQLGRHLPTYLNRPKLAWLDFSDDRTFYYTVVVVLGLVISAVVGMRRSRTGRALIACRENEAMAQAYGINLVRARLSAFMVSGAVAAVAGGFYAYAAFGAHPTDFGTTQSINVFVLAVIGGLGSVIGPLLGALYVGATTVFSTNALVGLAATGLGLVAVLLFAPGGLGQLVYGVRDSMLRRVAERYGIEVPSLFEDRKRARDKQAAIAAPTVRGVATFVPSRYRASGQWALEMTHKARGRG